MLPLIELERGVHGRGLVLRNEEHREIGLLAADLEPVGQPRIPALGAIEVAQGNLVKAD